MIRINCPDPDKIANEYYSRLSDWLHYGESDCKLQHLINKYNEQNFNKAAKMMTLFKKELRSIIREDLGALKKRWERFERQYRTEIGLYENTTPKKRKETAFGIFQKDMISLFNRFMRDNGADEKSNGVWLTQRLGVRTCPYCNRQYIFTIAKTGGQSSIRPQIDHFIPKSKYPLLVLSFYNLIPACSECNRIKREEELDIYPYTDGFDSLGLRFRVGKYNEDDKIIPQIVKSDDFEIFIENGEGNANVKNLCLQELYGEHKDYVSEIIDKCEAYNKSYYETLIRGYKGLCMTEGDIHRIIWGAYIDVSEHGRRPLSKLTKDIMEQFEVVV